MRYMKSYKKIVSEMTKGLNSNQIKQLISAYGIGPSLKELNKALEKEIQFEQWLKNFNKEKHEIK